MISIRNISAMQPKKFCRKGCRLYASHVLEAKQNETPSLEGFHVLKEFRDVFPDEVPGLPPKRDIDFIIDLVPIVAPVSKTPYRMSTPKLLEMNGLVTYVDLNVLPLGSYDILIGMDWLEAHRVNLDCYHKTLNAWMKKET